ncbi:MAG: cytochrome d ubiquinol oxidase subunit [Candidatus Midichloriaceae bacterium]|jgi:cytochrome d ubiquinol oxidase subunit I|nr:cytochrome d ubiquinol oxidase subunit [Candidatus Midichloriaceae bacterium]
MAWLDPLILSRIHFAFTISFHIIFPSFTIGLAAWLAVLKFLHLKTNKEIYSQIYQHWIKIFAVSFAMGVVSGILLSYQFGTNWSVFSRNTGNVLGPLMGYEVLTAFFLEASFLGIMLFGHDKVSNRMHLVATLIVAIGTVISAFWILSANSWMHTPAGYRIDENGVFYPTDWVQVVFNPSFVYRFIHMVLAAYLTTSFVVAGVAGYYFIKGIHKDHAKIMLGMAMITISILSPLQIFAGDLQGLGTLKHQPVKVAAMEGIWEDEVGANLRLFGVPDEEAETTRYSVEIPYATGLILTHSLTGEVKGLKNWPKDERPPVAIVFYAFRIMVGLGFVMLFIGIAGTYLYFRGKLFETRWFNKACLLCSPIGFISILSGWFVAECGRQPYVVYGLLKTKDAISPVPAESILFSLITFICVYSMIFGFGLYYVIRLMRKGPDVIGDVTIGSHNIKDPIAVIDVKPKRGKNV